MSTDTQLDLNALTCLPWRDPALIQRVLAECAASSEPATAFMNLARVCVPLLADACKVSVEDGLRSDASLQVSGCSIVTSVSIPARAWGSGYRVTVAFTWKRAMHVDDADRAIASLLVGHIAESVTCERLVTELERSTDQVTGLSDALISNRRIGQAVGIIMATRKVTDQRAFDLLRTVSQHSHRKLRDIADEVSLTGMLDLSHVPSDFRLRPPTTVTLPIRSQS